MTGFPGPATGWTSPFFLARGSAAESLLLVLLALGMGIRHGLDPDHLTAIDAILRFQSVRKRMVRWTGLLFSLGHGIVVLTLGGLIVNLVLLHVRIPPPLSLAGGLFSGLFLLGMAGANGLSLARSGPGIPFSPVGPRARILLRSFPLDRPVFAVLLGMLFAVSFDTLSQTVVFSLAAASLGGKLEGLAVGIAFVLGMSLTDGANGLWIARLIERSDLGGVRLSRVMGWTVALLSLLVGLFVLVTTFMKDAIFDSPLTETLTGVGVILVLSLAYFGGSRFVRDPSS